MKRPLLEEKMDTYYVSNALAEIWALIGRTNKYIDETAPWTLSKNEEGKEKLKSVMNHLAENLRKIAILLIPFMPQTSNKILEQLGIDIKTSTWDTLKTNNAILKDTKVIPKGEPLFVRLDS